MEIAVMQLDAPATGAGKTTEFVVAGAGRSQKKWHGAHLRGGVAIYGRFLENLP